MRIRALRVALVAASVLAGVACDESRSVQGPDQGRAEIDPPSDVVTWGCDKVIPELREHSPPGWRDEAVVVGDFGFYGMAGDFNGFRLHRRSDIQVKVPIAIEGDSPLVLWLPAGERDRAGLIMADVTRRGPANSYRLEDGHRGVRFEPCPGREWNGWTAGLALADRRKITLMVKEDGASSATPVALGPWEVDALWRLKRRD
ncbi:MAG TPA: hypothetical protein VG318_01350 [Actinomycetota bacterium]|nr:hypothetical protein [Actinomycetota bacterium]